MSDGDPSTVKEPVLKRLKVGNYSRTKMRKMILGLTPLIGNRNDSELVKMVTANSKPLKEKTDKTKVNYSQLENMPNEILLKIFNYINPKIKELLLFGQVSRRIRSVAHDHSLWQTVKLSSRRIVPTRLLQLILENGCKRITICSQIVGTLTLNQESQLEFLNSWDIDPRVLTTLLASCHSLEQLHLSNIVLNDGMISSICNQNGQTLKVLEMAHCKHQEQAYWCESCGKYFTDIRSWTSHKRGCYRNSRNKVATRKKDKRTLVCTICGYKSTHIRNFEHHVVKKHKVDATFEWIQQIIDNCTELHVLDLRDTPLSEESIEYVAKNVTATISKLWLYGMKSSTLCEKIVQILENRCNNLSKLRTGLRPGGMYYIGWQIDNPPIYILKNVSISFRNYE